MKQTLAMGCVVGMLGLLPSFSQAEDKKAVDPAAPAAKTHVMQTQLKESKTSAVNGPLTDKDYTTVELAPGKTAKRLTTAPAASAPRLNPGSAAADTLVGTYDAGHNYSEKTPPEQAADRHPQMGINPGSRNERYQEKGKVMTPQAPTTRPQMKNQ